MTSRLSTKLTLSYVLISLITLIIMEGLFFVAIYQYYVSGMEQTLMNNAEASATMFNKYAPAGTMKDKQDFIFENLSTDENALVEIYNADSDFLINNSGDTKNATELTPDYKTALKGKADSWKGKIETREQIISVSVPILDGEKVVGVMRYVSSMSMAHALLKSNFLVVFMIGLFILALAALIGHVMGSLILVPIHKKNSVTQKKSNRKF